MDKTDHRNLDGQSVLVTGGAGFIGSRLSTRLTENTELTVVDNFSVGNISAVPDEARIIEEDITDRESVLDSITDVDVIFHQAGLVSVSQSVQSPYESHTSNATGTVNILDAAREHNARVVIASSAAIYGHPEYTPIDEKHPFDLRLHTGLTSSRPTTTLVSIPISTISKQLPSDISTSSALDRQEGITQE